MQDISLFVDMYFRFGIVLRNICQKKSNYCAYIVSNKTEWGKWWLLWNESCMVEELD